ncbi:non-canonical purine NTP pyrophosphatase, RdgB/HAM1 family [candidate division KSB1 bacterium RBG_16_48_16]|nr:MAG: non-canonical purine NTP pyrophosphatase, RdgB/HAM1 family [candidate division KSB1 bacterium RBG_16_48_16]
MKKLLLATRNADKVKEIREFLQHLRIQILSVNDINGLVDVEEDQPTLAGNAIKKATVLSQQAGLPALADDTGLEVEALGAGPGVMSSRFAGASATYDDNIQKLLRELEGIPERDRKARFRTVIAFAEKGKVETVEGVCEGVILTAKRGDGGFGYDPVFYVPERKKTFAEMSLKEKNEISHRGVALRKARIILERYFEHNR